jgi:hypothetical protein
MQKIKDENIYKIYFYPLFYMDEKFGVCLKERTWIKDVSEQGTEENIWIYEGKLEKGEHYIMKSFIIRVFQ